MNRHLFILVCSLFLITGIASAQQNVAFIKGELIGAGNVEMSVIAKCPTRSYLISSYTNSPKDSLFAFAVPVVDSAAYLLKITLMKKGHVRLEPDTTFSFSLPVKPNNRYQLQIRPGLFSTDGTSGFKMLKGGGQTKMALVKVITQWNALSPGLTICKVVGGQLSTLQTCRTMTGNDELQFYIPVEKEGFYYFNSISWNKRIYLKPGDNLTYQMNWKTKDGHWVEGSPENELLQKWEDLIHPITAYGYTKNFIFSGVPHDLDKFTTEYKRLQPALTSFKLTNKLSNQRFNQLFTLAQQVDNELAALNFLYFFSSKKIVSFLFTKYQYINVPEYFKDFLPKNKVGDDPDLFRIGEGALYINRLGKFALAQLNQQQIADLTKAEQLAIMLKYLPSDAQKSSFLNDALSETEVSNYSDFKRIFRSQQKYAASPLVRSKYERVLNQFIGDTVFIGQPVLDVALPDANGKMVKLNGFKNKVVLIDTWASWCGPCKEQVPFLKEIEAEYEQNSGIVFIGLSIDRKEDTGKWKNAMRQLGLHGIQLIDYSGKLFARPYGITAIPRFLLLGKDGRWIEVRCPIPASKLELKSLIDAALQ